VSTRRRDFYIGAPGSPPKRLRLEDLEEIISQVRDAVEAIAEDLGIPEEKRTPVELVDMMGGSTGLAFEQQVPESYTQAPLAVLVDAASDQVQGLPPPKYLTDLSRRVINETVVTLARLASRGSPVRVLTYPDAPDPPAPAGDSEPFESTLGGQKFLSTFDGSPSSLVRMVAFPADVPPQVPEEAGTASPPVSGEPARWLVAQSGKVERLDEGAKKLTLRVGRRLVGPLQLDDEQFQAVDGDGVRWKTALVRARSSVPELRADSEVLDVTPHDAEPVSTFEPETTTAAAMAPVLRKLRRLRKLQRGWDSYTAEPPPPGAISDAEKLVLALAMREQLPVPFAAPVSTGAVQLEWESDERYLEFEFTGGGRIAAFRTAEDGEYTEERISRERALQLVAWFAGAR
jgi:hypothetical protein